MKQKKILFTLAFLCLQTTQSLFAYDFKVDGIGYDITSVSNMEVEVAAIEIYDTKVVVVPSTVTFDGKTFSVTSLRGATSINSYTRDRWSFSGGAFNGLSWIEEIVLPNTIKVIPKACFPGCTSLISIHLPQKLEVIEDHAFHGCKSLVNIEIPSTVSMIGYEAFRQCSSIKSLSLPSDAEIEGYMAFEGCKSLESIVIPQYFGKKDSNSKAFSGCTNLVSVIFADYYYNRSIGPEMFQQCNSLKTIILSDSINIIGGQAFCGCSELKSIRLPLQLKHIYGTEVFKDCSQLNNITSPNKYPPQIDNANNFSGATLLNGTLYVPRGCVSDYRNAEGWKEFVNIREIGQEESFSLNAYCNKGGSLNINGQTISNQVLSIGVSRNQSITISITPDDGYYIKSVTLNGRDVKDDLYNNTYTIAQIKEDIDFRVEFAKVATFLSLKQPTGSMDIVVKEGESQTIRLVPESGYTIHSVTYNGKDVTNQLAEDNTFVTPEITDNSVLYVIYENGDNPPVSHAKYLTIKHSENGVVKQKITLGRSYTYKISPVSGQKLTALYFNGVDVTSEIKGDKFTTPVLNDNATLEVEFEDR